jgi:hypothetical protein
MDLQSPGQDEDRKKKTYFRRKIHGTGFSPDNKKILMMVDTGKTTD